jgi:hypothetical protein
MLRTMVAGRVRGDSFRIVRCAFVEKDRRSFVRGIAATLLLPVATLGAVRVVRALGTRPSCCLYDWDLGFGAWLVLAAWVIVVLALLARRPRPVGLTVASDGLVFWRGGWTRFVPFRSIREVTPFRGEARRHPRRRPTAELGFDLYLSRTAYRVITSWGSAGVHNARILEAIARAQATWRADPPTEAPLLAPSADTRAWVHELRAWGDERGPYRAPDPAGLALVVESPAAAPRARIAAAIALLAGSPETMRTRIVRAFEASGAPALRAAMTTLLDETADEAALARALDNAARTPSVR